MKMGNLLSKWCRGKRISQEDPPMPAPLPSASIEDLYSPGGDVLTDILTSCSYTNKQRASKFLEIKLNFPDVWYPRFGELTIEEVIQANNQQAFIESPAPPPRRKSVIKIVPPRPLGLAAGHRGSGDLYRIDESIEDVMKVVADSLLTVANDPEITLQKRKSLVDIFVSALDLPDISIQELYDPVKPKGPEFNKENAIEKGHQRSNSI